MNKKNSRLVPLALFCFSVVIFPSCMHTMMSGHGDSSHKPDTATALEKEVTSGDLKAIASFPPLEEGRKARLSLRLSSSAASSPISHARVFAYVQQPVASGDERSMHDHSTHAASVDTFDVAEQEQRGLYEFTYTPHHAGNYAVTFEILEIESKAINPPMRISSERAVSTQHSSHEGGMHGSGNATVPALIGVAVMGAMMVAMLIAGGRMF